jgi:hypothetical protein
MINDYNLSEGDKQFIKIRFPWKSLLKDEFDDASKDGKAIHLTSLNMIFQTRFMEVFRLVFLSLLRAGTAGPPLLLLRELVIRFQKNLIFYQGNRF